MRVTMRRLGLVLFGLSLGFLGLASAAWACSPGPQVDLRSGSASTNPPSGPSGSKVAVNGKDFGSGPVEIRWNSLDGPKLGEGHGPNFSVAVIIPQAEPDVYTLLAVQYTPSGSVRGQARAPFEVTSSSDPGSTNPPPKDEPSQQPSQQSASSGGGEEPAPSKSSSGGSKSNSTPPPSGGSSQSQGPGSSGSTQSPESAPAAAAAQAATGHHPSATGRPTADLAGAAQASSAPGTAPADELVTSGPLPATSFGDVDSGFETGLSSSLEPSLFDAAATAPKDHSLQLAVGLGMLSLGGLTLLSGVAVAEVRRRRVLADVGGPS